MKKYVGTDNEKDGWFLTSKAHRIYHWQNKDKFNYLYYDLEAMRNFVLREWNKPKDVNWIKKLSYVAGDNSDNALLIPICINDDKFKPYIRQVPFRVVHALMGAVYLGWPTNRRCQIADWACSICRKTTTTDQSSLDSLQHYHHQFYYLLTVLPSPVH